MKWKYETLSRKPSEFEKANDTQWMQRKDIEKHTRSTESGETEVYYTCQMRFITNEQYLTLNTVNSADDLTKVKEALADIYIELLSK